MQRKMVLFSLILALCGSLLPSSSAGDLPDVDFDLCERCGSEDLCSAPVGNASTCFCDLQCETFGDCCPDKPPCNKTADTSEPLQFGQFHCRSIFLNASTSRPPGLREAFWMSSTCPESWSEDGLDLEGWIAGNCTDDVSTLPPVTDIDTGLVYRNEYCAICSDVRNAITWTHRLTCSAQLSVQIRNSSFQLTMDDLKEECYVCSFVEPNTDLLINVSPARQCYPHVATCMGREELETVTQSTWTEDKYNITLESCVGGPYSQVVSTKYETKTRYRNQYCALCNGVNAIGYYCFWEPKVENSCVPEGTPPQGIAGLPFSVVLDIHGDGQVVAQSEVISTTITISCSEGEVFDPVLETCRQTLCLGSFQPTTGGACIPPLVSNETVECPEGEGVVALNKSEVEIVDNSTVMYGEEQYQVIAITSDGIILICLPQEGAIEVNVTVLYYSYPDGFLVITYVGCSLSVLGCALILLTYSLFKELRTVPSKILMNLSVAILISNLFILFSGLGKDSQDFCTATAIILHLFFLAQFSWMSIMVFEMGRTFRAAQKLLPQSSSRFKTKLLLTYMVLGWSIPLLITAITVTVNFTTDDLVLYGKTEDGEEGSCWINHQESALLAFVLPIVISLIFNAIIFVFVSVFLYSAWRTRANLEKRSTSHLRVYLAVVSITGLTWVFGLLALVARSDWAWYPFIILNAGQGFLIFLAFLFTMKVGKLYLELFSIKKYTSSLSSKQTSSIQLQKNSGLHAHMHKGSPLPA